MLSRDSGLEGGFYRLRLSVILVNNSRMAIIGEQQHAKTRNEPTVRRNITAAQASVNETSHVIRHAAIQLPTQYA
jgi:hypothetical protein